MTIKCPPTTTTTSYDNFYSSYSSTPNLFLNNLFLYSVLLYVTSSVFVSSAPIDASAEQEHRRLKLHKDFQFIRSQLEEYGYLRGQPSLHEFKKALKHFQNVLGVEETAEIDVVTVEAASRPRCVHEDVNRRNDGASRTKRFSISRQFQWDSKHFSGNGNTLRLKWHISAYSSDMNRDTTKNIVRKAFELWSKQSDVKNQKRVSLIFSEASSKEDADIDILWANGPHGDEYDFDSSSRKTNVLAHTFFPAYEYPLNGDIHFDDNVDWYLEGTHNDEDSTQVFFPYVVAHEIGHSLGLHHSGRKDSLMYPYYKNVPLDEIKLSVDDRCGISWTYSGSSPFCVFVWLMSELVEYRQDLMNGENNGASPITGYRPTSKQPTKVNRLPKCTAHNDFRRNAALGLRKQVQMNEEDSIKYAEVLCNFLAGLHMHRASKQYYPGQSLEMEFAGVNKQVNTFSGGAKTHLKRMLRHAEQLREQNQPSIFDPEYFNAEFYDKFFQDYYHSSS